MQKFYVRENTGAILDENEYDNVPHHNPANDNYRLLGKFVDKSQARRHYYQFKETEAENGKRNTNA